MQPTDLHPELQELAAIEAESIGWIPLDHQLAGDNVIRGV